MLKRRSKNNDPSSLLGRVTPPPQTGGGADSLLGAITDAVRSKAAKAREKTRKPPGPENKAIPDPVKPPAAATAKDAAPDAIGKSTPAGGANSDLKSNGKNTRKADTRSTGIGDAPAPDIGGEDNSSAQKNPKTKYAWKTPSVAAGKNSEGISGKSAAHASSEKTMELFPNNADDEELDAAEYPPFDASGPSADAPSGETAADDAWSAAAPSRRSSGADPSAAVVDRRGPRMIMAEWKPDNWTPPKTFGGFPLREICPDAAKHFAEGGHFSPRDIKNIIGLLDLEDADPKDPASVYDKMLDLAERSPWVFSGIEFIVCLRRMGNMSRKPLEVYDDFTKCKKIVDKFPVTKFRLKYNPDLHARVSELALPEVKADIAVAAFCEYAFHNCSTMKHTTESDEFNRRFGSILNPKSGFEHIEARLGDPDFVEDWSQNAEHLLGMLEENPEIRSKRVQEHLMLTLEELTSMLHQESGAGDFRLIASLAEWGGAHSERLTAARRDMIVEEVERAGIGIGEGIDAVPDSAIPLLEELSNSGVLEDLGRADDEIRQLMDVVERLRAEMHEAQENEDYEKVAELAGKAKDAKTAVDEAREKRKRREEVVRSVIDGRIGTIDELEEMRVGFEPEVPDADAGGDGSGEAESDVPDGSASSDGAKPKKSPAFEGVSLERARRLFGPRKKDHAAETPDSEETEKDIPEAVPEAPPAPPPIDTEVLAELVSRDIIGVAADAAEAIEADGGVWPLEAAALRAAAAARAPYRQYGPDAQRFSQIANRAISAEPGDLGSSLLLGALMRPAIMEPNSPLRNGLPTLCEGEIGQHLKRAADFIAALEYDFPPNADELAELSGARRVPLKQRTTEPLAEWCDLYSKKKSKWPFATAFMRHVASEQGLIGQSLSAIENGSKDALQKARKAIEILSSAAPMKNAAQEFGVSANIADSRLYPKGIDYLNRQFEEPLALLDAWARATEHGGSHAQRSAAKTRDAVRDLLKHLDKAAKALEKWGKSVDDPVTRAVAGWIVRQVKISIKSLKGEKFVGFFKNLDEALTAERALLPSAFPEAGMEAKRRLKAIKSALTDVGALAPDAVIERARANAAFETAGRISERFGRAADKDILEDMTAFAKKWRAEVETRRDRLRFLARMDSGHHDEVARGLDWCAVALERLAAALEDGEVQDLADIPDHAEELDRLSDRVEEGIRSTQKERIESYRNERNADDAKALFAALDDPNLNIDTIEDRIAQLRDGRPAAALDTELDGLMREFAPDFVAFAASPGWPASIAGFRKALAGDGELATEEDRRAEAVDIINLYRDAVATGQGRIPAADKIGAFFAGLGFENAKVSDIKKHGADSRQAMLNGAVRPKGWFLPPAFGSEATTGWKLLLVGADTSVDDAEKALDPGAPAVLLAAGVVDPDKRREFALRLRSGNHPVLFIDEALVVFAAIRREPTARVVFECGLPYGRIEPYATESDNMPPEMFFGRAAEIQAIMSKTPDGCLVYGGRKLGKSALLNHVCLTRGAPNRDHIVLRRDVSTPDGGGKASEIWTRLKEMLAPFGVVAAASRGADEVSRDIEKWLSDRPDGRIVCMFDGADHFMDADTKADFPELGLLGKLMEDTGYSFKAVFAGAQGVQRTLSQPNSPFANFGAPICVGPLSRTEDDRRAAHELVVQPVRAAGFRFESMEAVEEILAWANYYPSLIQEYAKGIISAMHDENGGGPGLNGDGPLWTIPTKDLFQHRNFGKIQARVRQKFHWTLDLDPRYALIAYTLARLAAEGKERRSFISGFKPAMLLDEASAFWPRNMEHPSPTSFEALLNEMFDLGVLGRVPSSDSGEFNYLLRTRQVADMLGSPDDIDEMLEQIQDLDPAVAYDGAINRRRNAPRGTPLPRAEWPYSPLTDRQIENIARPGAAGVSIVCGLKALGLSKVGEALKNIVEADDPRGKRREKVTVEIAPNDRDFNYAVNSKRVGDDRSLIVVFEPPSAEEAEDAIIGAEDSPRVIEGRVRPVILLDAADDVMRDLANRRRDQSQFLTAWGAEMIRVHLDSIGGSALDTRPLRKAILDASGGIPTEAVKLIEEMSSSSDPAAVAESWKVGDELPRSILEGPLGKALHVLDLADGGDDESLDDLLREEVGCDWVTIGPDLMASGLIANWNAKQSSHNQRSALGDLVMRMI